MKRLTDILEGLLTGKDVNIDIFNSHVSAVLYRLLDGYVNSPDNYKKDVEELKLRLVQEKKKRRVGLVTVPQKDDHIYISFTWTVTRSHDMEIIEVWYNDTVYVICWDKLMGSYGDRNQVNSFELDVASWMDFLEEDGDAYGAFELSRVMYDMGNAKSDRAAGEILKTIESIRTDKI